MLLVSKNVGHPIFPDRPGPYILLSLRGVRGVRDSHVLMSNVLT